MKVNRILCIATLLVTLSVVGAFAQTPNVDLTPLTSPPKLFRDLKGGFINVGFDRTISGGIRNMCGNLPEGYACFTLDKPVLGYSQSGKGTWVYGYLPVELPWVQGDDKRTIVIIHLASMKIVRVADCGNRFYHETSLTETKPEPPKPAATPCPTPPPCVPFAEPKVTEAVDKDGNKILTKDFGCGRVEVQKTTTRTVCEGGWNDIVGPTPNGKGNSFKVGKLLVPSSELSQAVIDSIWLAVKQQDDLAKRFVKDKDDAKNFKRFLDSKVVFLHVQDPFCEPGKLYRVEIRWEGFHKKEFFVGLGVGLVAGTFIGHYAWPREITRTPDLIKNPESGGVRTLPNGEAVRGPIGSRDGIRTVERPLGGGSTDGHLPIGRTIGGNTPVGPTPGNAGVPRRLP